MTDEKIVEKFMEQRNEVTGGRLSGDELLLVSFEYASLCVARGANPDSPEFTMYAIGRRMILDRMSGEKRA